MQARAMHGIEETVGDTPFPMPIAVVDAQARLGGPLRLGVRAGASLATTLRGCYETALLRAGCAVSSGPRCCERTPADEPGAVVCARPDACPIPALYKPRSEAQRRDHASPIGLWARQTAERLVDVRMVLWGRRALAARSLAFEALVEGDGGIAVPAACRAWHCGCSRVVRHGGVAWLDALGRSRRCSWRRVA
jgi:hypothetical protein